MQHSNYVLASVKLSLGGEVFLFLMLVILETGYTLLLFPTGIQYVYSKSIISQ